MSYDCQKVAASLASATNKAEVYAILNGMGVPEQDHLDMIAEALRTCCDCDSEEVLEQVQQELAA